MENAAFRGLSKLGTPSGTRRNGTRVMTPREVARDEKRETRSQRKKVRGDTTHGRASSAPARAGEGAKWLGQPVAKDSQDGSSSETSAATSTTSRKKKKKAKNKSRAPSPLLQGTDQGSITHTTAQQRLLALYWPVALPGC